jgi:hypothetical protein
MAARGAGRGVMAKCGMGRDTNVVRDATSVSEVPATRELGGAIGETVELDANMESNSSGREGWGLSGEAKGREDSLKTMCRETNRWLEEKSRHRYPLCS